MLGEKLRGGRFGRVLPYLFFQFGGFYPAHQILARERIEIVHNSNENSDVEIFESLPVCVERHQSFRITPQEGSNSACSHKTFHQAQQGKETAQKRLTRKTKQFSKGLISLKWDGKKTKF